MTGQPMAVLWNPAADSFPRWPEFSRPLADPALRGLIRRLASDLGYAVF
jgi:hypothetical protein